MKKTVLLLLALFVFAGICRAYSPIIDGALADVRLKVVDDRGEAVSNAAVSVTFHVTPEKADVRRGTTDGDGVFSAKGRCIGEAYAWIRRDGYYETKIAPTFRKFSYEDAKRTRRWSDGTVETVATLKKKRNPVTLAFHYCEYRKFPATNKVVKLDLETLEWCPPYGNGRHDDVHMVFDAVRNPKNWYDFHEHLSIAFPNCRDGFYFRKVDKESAFKYCYYVETNSVFMKSYDLRHARTEASVTNRVEFPKDSYLVYRVRTQTNSLGQITHAHYGRIGEKTSQLIGLRMRSWFNPVDNDVNLEDAREW